MTINTNTQKEIFLTGKNLFLLKTVLEDKGRIKRIAIESTKASTPPALLGIDRRIAYANKKYHSGWIWAGVTRGLAAIKFSGSPKSQGKKKLIRKNTIKNITNPMASIKVK